MSPDATPFGPGRQVIQCAANVSEGRRPDVIARLAGSGAVEGAVVADVSSDADHNRTVISLLGDAGGLREAVCALAEACVAELDLGTHTGVHPRLGVLDVVPFTPMRHACMSECIRVSLEIGAEIARRTGISVYFYERSAYSGRPSALPEIRRLARPTPDGPSLHPDIAATDPRPSAGACVVGARGPLVAYNIALDRGDAATARRIASAIRAARERLPALRGVRSLGLYLAEANVAQVSMNLTEPAVTRLSEVYAFVRAEAERLGAAAGDSEVIGLIPARCLDGATEADIRLRTLRPTQVIENWLSD